MIKMKILKRILNLTLIDRERSGDVKKRCVVQKISDWVQSRREDVERVSKDRQSQYNYYEGYRVGKGSSGMLWLG